MKKNLTIAFVSFFCLSFAQNNAKTKPKTTKPVVKTATTKPVATTVLKTKLDTISYFIGIQIGEDMKKNGASALKPSTISKGISDAFAGTLPIIDMQAAMQLAQVFFTEQQTKKNAEKTMKDKLFLDQNKQRLQVVYNTKF